MFFLVIGARVAERLLAVVRDRCPNCGAVTRQRYWERATRLTLFLIPVLTISRRAFRECTNCGWTVAVDPAEAERARASAGPFAGRR